jgi:hypothetical protein
MYSYTVYVRMPKILGSELAQVNEITFPKQNFNESTACNKILAQT